jgi:drug/metabolite transporter (DMT)-like permease
MASPTPVPEIRDVPAGGSSDLKARVLLVVLCFGWGTTWVAMRIALEEIPPFGMRVSSLTLGAIVLTFFARLQGRALAIANRRSWTHVCVASLFNIVLFSVFTPFAQLHAETSRVAILVYTMPIWAAMLALPVLRERMSPTRIAALVLCIAGLAILVGPLVEAGVPAGIVLALGAAVSWAIGTVYLKWAQPAGDLMALTIWQLAVAILAVGACMLAFEGSLHLDVSARALTGMAYTGVIGTGLCYFLWFDSVRRLPTSTAALGVLSSPVIGVVSAMIVLGERPTLFDAVGFALMLAASAVVLLRPDGAAPQPR